MSQEGYFERYIQILDESFKKINKIGFKKLPALKPLFQTFEGFLNKQVYGRIQPSNYLLLFILLLGAKNSKLYPIIIQTIQKLFSNNYIAASEDLNSSIRFIKDEHKEYLFLSVEEYSKKYFHEVYIQTLIALSDRDEALNLLICKNMSLIFRLSQNSISQSLLVLMKEFIVEAIFQNKSEDIDKILKSTLLEMIRHSIESLKQIHDKKFLQDDDTISVKENAKRYSQILTDKAALKAKAQEVHDVHDYDPVPKDLTDFKCLPLEVLNQNNEVNGKFGWCIICQKSANYYCKNYRVPVCSYSCKQKNLHETQQAQKIQAEDARSQVTFEKHVELICKLIKKYLAHQDIRKRSGFAQIFVHLSSELKKISTRSLTPEINESLKDIFRECTKNVIMETEAFSGCIIALKKLIPLNIFLSQVSILFDHLAKKILHFMTPPQIKQEIIKFFKDCIRTDVIFEYFIVLDLSPEKKDIIAEVVQAISKVYTGIKAPEGLIIPPEDISVRKAAYQTLVLLQKSIRTSNKFMNQEQRIPLLKIKAHKNKVKKIINDFNNTEKPLKIIKRLIKEGELQNSPEQISEFLHQNLQKLSFTNVGILIGDIDELAQSIRDAFIGSIKFKRESVDEGLRILLAHFTIPGQSQVVERIIDSFSQQYYQQNLDTKIFLKYDAVYSFSYLLMMLQTNLHNPQVVQKMTLAQFANLSKNMNGEGLEFPADFLEATYESIQRKQLGFHEKHKEMQLNNAYQQNLMKKAQQIYSKQLQKQAKVSFQGIIKNEDVIKVEKFHIELLINECYENILETMAVRLHETEQKQKEEIIRITDVIQNMIKLSIHYKIESLVGKTLAKLWDQIIKIISLKKYILIEKLLLLVKEYHLYVYDQWNVVIYLFSMFYRNKLIKKQPKESKESSNKNSILVMINEKSYIYDHYIEYIFSKSTHFNHKNLQKMVLALIQNSKQEIKENYHPFCLDKINDILEYNSSRLTLIIPFLWPLLSKYYIELGQNKLEKTAIFGTDFLKQQITKFFKKKDLIPFQKQYLQPLEEIFTSNVALVVKQYIIGSISYFVNNHNINIKSGWKVILPILSAAFDEDEDPSVKEKAHNIVKQIYDSHFRIIDLEENYSDFVQILGRMAREKEQVYQKSCLLAANMITSFYHKKLQMNLEEPSQNNIDINFWQTRWLPLLSTIYSICGDFRPNLQKDAVQCLFGILMKYGKLFDYEFWKMILQGVLRPTFQQITYTSQSKSIQKNKLEQWLKNSFSLLFESISELIQTFFNDFQLFLSDVFKIYESCILSNSNKILVQLSMQALTDLLKNVGDKFQQLNWNEYIEFVENLSRKTSLYEIDSVESWIKNKDLPDSTYENKYLAINLLLLNLQTILQKFSSKLSFQQMKNIDEYITKIYKFCRSFNLNISLRETLWKNGFFSNMNSLPGLVKQEYESLKTLTILKFKIIEKSQDSTTLYIDHILQIFKICRDSLILAAPKAQSLEVSEKQRQSKLIEVLILDLVIAQIHQIGLNKMIDLGYRQKLFENFLELCNKKTYCSKCKSCEKCETNRERENKFASSIKNLLVQLFNS